MPIFSERLELIPMTADFLRLSLEGSKVAAEELLGVHIPVGWPRITNVLSLRLRQLESEPALEPWLLRAMVLRNNRTMVGHIGFHTAPGAEYLEMYSPGAVEFGFTIFPDFRRQGYAREASRALMEWACQEHDVQKFVLTISPENKASQALAAQLGFGRIGSHHDVEDGIEDILERKIAAASTCNNS